MDLCQFGITFALVAELFPFNTLFSNEWLEQRFTIRNSRPK